MGMGWNDRWTLFHFQEVQKWRSNVEAQSKTLKTVSTLVSQFQQRTVKAMNNADS
jgi:hypothetical protein